MPFKAYKWERSVVTQTKSQIQRATPCKYTNKEEAKCNTVDADSSVFTDNAFINRNSRRANPYYWKLQSAATKCYNSEENN